MGEAALVNKVASSTPASNTGPCTSCPTEGLPILFTRYAVVPKAVSLNLPGPCAKPYLDPADAKKLALKESHHALRTLRAGFVYLYYQVPDTGQWRWFCYMSTPKGMLREIPINTQGPMLPEEIPCNRKEHRVKAAIIALQKPEQIEKVYIAFAEHHWLPETRERYAKALKGKGDSPLKKRFIEFSPAAWMAKPEQDGAMVYTQGHNQIVEYYEANPLDRQFKNGYYEYHSRSGQYLELQQHMNTLKPGRGAVIALPDPIGCAMELNLARLAVFKDFSEYVGDPNVAWKLRTSEVIEGLREVMKRQAVAEVEEEDKKDKKAPAQNSTTMTRGKSARIVGKTSDKLGDLEDHYNKKKLNDFRTEYKKRATDADAVLKVLDADYCAWVTSESFACALEDYLDNHICDAYFYSEAICMTHEGGALTEKSQKMWQEMLDRAATDPKHYVTQSILSKQDDWLKAFEDADPMTIGKHLGDAGTVSKLYDILKNTVESFVSSQEKSLIHQISANPNEYNSRLLNTTTGVVSGLSASTRQIAGQSHTDASAAAQQAMSDAVKKLEDTQRKLGLAFSSIAYDSSAVMLTIDLNMDEWRTAMMREFMRNLDGVSRQASDKLSALALAAKLRLPPSSAMADVPIPFTFWILEPADKLIKKLESIFGKTAEISTGAAAKTLRKYRQIKVIGHNLREGARQLAQARIPSQVLAPLAVAAATQLSRNSAAMLKSKEVHFSGAALLFQAYALRAAIDDWGKKSGWKHEDATWTMVSGAIGVAGASLELYAKGTITKKGDAAKVFRGTVSAELVVKIAGRVSAGASFVDAVQGTIRASTYFKQGDKDAGVITGFGAAAALGAGVASWAIAGGSAAFFSASTIFGPVGWLVVAIGIGLFCAYMTFMLEDKPVQIWLDRCIFGNHGRIEGPFPSLKHEMDGLELLGRQLVVEVEWEDVALDLVADKISVVVKRPPKQGDALFLGLVVSGPGGQRRALPWIQGVPPSTPLPYPAVFENKAGAIPIGQHPDLFHDRDPSAETKGEKPEEWIWVTKQAWLLNTRMFQTGVVYLRYFPDASKLDEYYDDELKVKD
ncbi:MAG: hypothetical protein H6R15_1438 [Proteobacteria bacterium]|nr:hypothetical protein [Pseudomonadota bacterium]